MPFGYCQAIWNSTAVITAIIGEDYALPLPELTTALAVHTPQNFGETSLVVIGPSGIGKTTYALWIAPKPALVVTHLDDLRQLTSRVKSIVFDDMTFSHHPRESQIHLVDRYLTRSIHMRYRTATIPAGIVKIFTANYYPFIQDSAIERRVNLLNV
jgi:hypothetical protein